MNRTLKLLIAGALALPALSFAEGLSYNYVEAGFSQFDPDGGGDELDGWTLAGSLAIAPNWHLVADFNRISPDGGDDVDTFRVGGGYNRSLNPTTDFIGRLAWVRLDAGSFEEDGFNLQALVRSQLMPSFELEGGLDYVDFGGNSGDTTSLVAAGRYFFTPAFAGGLNVKLNDDFKSYGVDLRFNFK